MSGVDRLACSECKATWEDFEEEPPCKTCKPQIMLPVNVTPITIYCQCVGSLPVSPMDAMRLHSVNAEDKETCLDSVQLIASIVDKLQTKDRDKKRKKSK